MKAHPHARLRGAGASAGCPRSPRPWRRTGAFALTEPAHGSDSVALETRGAARGRRVRHPNGAKRWIGNGSVADVIVVVGPRRGPTVRSKGLPSSRGGLRPGYEATPIAGKGVGARAIWQADNPPSTASACRSTQPACPGAKTRFRDAGPACSSPTARRVAPGPRLRPPPWSAYDTAPDLTASQREQFGRRPLASLPDRAGPAREDARRGHRDAAVLHAARAGSPTPGALFGQPSRGLAKLSNNAQGRAGSIGEAPRPSSAATGSSWRTTSIRHMADHRGDPTPSREPRRCRRSSSGATSTGIGAFRVMSDSPDARWWGRHPARACAGRPEAARPWRPTPSSTGSGVPRGERPAGCCCCRAFGGRATTR